MTKNKITAPSIYESCLSEELNPQDKTNEHK